MMTKDEFAEEMGKMMQEALGEKYERDPSVDRFQARHCGMITRASGSLDV